jgi:hypothetical protein
LVLFLYVSAQLQGDPASPGSSGITQPFTEIKLNAFLRQSVSIADEQVPFAEVLVNEVLRGNSANVESAIQTFFKDDDVYRFTIYINPTNAGSIPWIDEGDRGLNEDPGITNLAITTLPLPDGKTITLKYLQVIS